jgi:hypothetical protein
VTDLVKIDKVEHRTGILKGYCNKNNLRTKWYPEDVAITSPNDRNRWDDLVRIILAYQASLQEDDTSNVASHETADTQTITDNGTIFDNTVNWTTQRRCSGHSPMDKEGP